ncbi:hypothetical protein WN944_012830 [Citrus x changshan-huyou]|uniref:Uncharacterized protein n=1 Tax=Citrus x changshan-huyou TaxID=2935761 RepID=A0AAP0QNG1_9ROSI
MNSEMGSKDDDNNNNAIENHLLNQCHKSDDGKGSVPYFEGPVGESAACSFPTLYTGSWAAMTSSAASV